MRFLRNVHLQSGLTEESFTLNTFNAVFVPTFLSIIWVIFYLRLWYVVGSAGILWAIAIILLAVSVTFSTALSLSSITTNIKIWDGGAYSIVSKTLGLEVWGSVWIPLYLAQVFSVSLYLFWFVEWWQFIFPNHPTGYILLGAFIVLFFLLTVRLHIALQVQKLVFRLVVLSIFTVWLPFDWIQHVVDTNIVGEFTNSWFWQLYALFFPAVTWLMAWIGLSWELDNPRKQIPKWVLAATIVTTCVYILMVFRFGQTTTYTELLSNPMAMVDHAYVPFLVLIWILGATYSSALTTFLAAPRLLVGMATKWILPWSALLTKKTPWWIPIIAVGITWLIIASTFVLWWIDAVAPILTMFFLISYSAINIVVFIEQSLWLPSFRPKLKIPKIIPLYWAISSVLCMFLINWFAAIVSILLLLLIYVSLIKKNLVPEEWDIRSWLFMVLAERAAKRIAKLPESVKHVRKPNILFPSMTSANLRGHFPLLHGIVAPNGTLNVLWMQHVEWDELPEDGELTRKQRKLESKELKELVERFGKHDIFTSFSEITVKDYTAWITISLEAIEGQVFHPNILFLPFRPNTLPKSHLYRIYTTALREHVGVILFSPATESRLWSQKDIQVWIPEEVLSSNLYDDKPYDLSLLISYSLHKNRDATITFCMNTEHTDQWTTYLNNLLKESRFPSSTKIEVFNETSLVEAIDIYSRADLTIVPTTRQTINMMRDLEHKDKSFLFVTDAGSEDVLS